MRYHWHTSLAHALIATLLFFGSLAHAETITMSSSNYSLGIVSFAEEGCSLVSPAYVLKGTVSQASPTPEMTNKPTSPSYSLYPLVTMEQVAPCGKYDHDGDRDMDGLDLATAIKKVNFDLIAIIAEFGLICH